MAAAGAAAATGASADPPDAASIKRTGRKLFFRVEGATSEDPEHPARALAVGPSATSDGWRCARFCAFPQALTLRLERPGSHVRSVQVLSHEALITRKLELWLGYLPPESEVGHRPRDEVEPVWKRLGHVGFGDNEKNDFGARELKSVALDEKRVTHVRLVLARCHVNKRNIYNQVGLVAVTVLGEPEGGAYGPSHGIGAAPTPYELELELSMDPATAEVVRELHSAKVAAVSREDYVEAKRLKEHIDRLRHVGVRVAQLEARKRHAEAREDYDTCKELKAEIDVLRMHGLQAATGARARAEKRTQQAALEQQVQQASLDQLTAPMPPPQSQRSLSRQHAVAAAQQPMTPQSEVAPQTPVAEPSPASVRAAATPSPVAAQTSAPAPELLRASPPANEAAPLGFNKAVPAANAYQSYDDRPVDGGGKTHAEHMELLEQEERERVQRGAVPSILSAGEKEASGDLSAEAAAGAAGAEQAPSEPSQPEPLSAADAKDARRLIELFGEHTIACAYSRTWSLREAALAKVEEEMSGACESDAALACRCTLRLLERYMADNNVAVFTAAQGALRACYDCASFYEADASELAAETENLCVALVKRVGDGNSRIKQQVEKTVIYLAGHDACGTTPLENAICISQSASKKASARGTVGRLDLLLDLVPKYSVYDGDSGGAHLTLSLVMKFAVAAFDDSSSDVRNRATKVVLECYQCVGNVVKRYLKNVKPAIRDVLETGFEQTVVGAGG